MALYSFPSLPVNNMMIMEVAWVTFVCVCVRACAYVCVYFVCVCVCVRVLVRVLCVCVCMCVCVHACVCVCVCCVCWCGYSMQRYCYLFCELTPRCDARRREKVGALHVWLCVCIAEAC